MKNKRWKLIKVININYPQLYASLCRALHTIRLYFCTLRQRKCWTSSKFEDSFRCFLVPFHQSINSWECRWKIRLPFNPLNKVRYCKDKDYFTLMSLWQTILTNTLTHIAPYIHHKHNFLPCLLISSYFWKVRVKRLFYNLDNMRSRFLKYLEGDNLRLKTVIKYHLNMSRHQT